MHGHPLLTAFGPERVSSIGELAEAIKRRQLLKPAGRFALQADGDNFAVALLPSGHIEIDGYVPSLRLEKEIDQALGRAPALLDDLLEEATCIPG